MLAFHFLINKETFKKGKMFASSRGGNRGDFALARMPSNIRESAEETKLKNSTDTVCSICCSLSFFYYNRYFSKSHTHFDISITH